MHGRRREGEAVLMAIRFDFRGFPWKRTIILVVLGFSVGVILGFCVPQPGFTTEPFASEPLAAKQLSYIAEYACYGEPEVPFSSDGCSASPDGTWVECCIMHDIRYWCGGSPKDRAYADRELRGCVKEKGYGEAHGLITELGVRVGGHPAMPFRWRWGYGYPYSFGYSSEQRGSIIRE